MGTLDNKLLMQLIPASMVHFLVIDNWSLNIQIANCWCPSRSGLFFLVSIFRRLLYPRVTSTYVKHIKDIFHREKNTIDIRLWI